MTRKEAKGNLIHAFRWNDMPKKEAIDIAIKALSEQRTGHWIEDENEMKVWCSVCGEENDKCSKYCPDCGSLMIEPQESEE